MFVKAFFQQCFLREYSCIRNNFYFIVALLEFFERIAEFCERIARIIERDYVQNRTFQKHGGPKPKVSFCKCKCHLKIHRLTFFHR